MPLAVAALAAAAAVTAEGEPTGLAAADAFWPAVTAAAVAVGASEARRWSWFALGLVAARSGDGIGAVTGYAALGVAFAGAAATRRSRVTGALVGALAVQSLLRQGAGTSLGLSLLAWLPAAGVLVSAWWEQRSDDRRRLARLAAAAALVVLVAGVAALVAALDARGDLDRAVGRGRSALEAARAGDSEAAAELFAVAADAFADAESSASSPLVWVARALPIAAPHVEVLDAGADAAGRVAEVAATAARSADTEQLQLRDGTLDLDLLRSMQEPLADVAAAAEDAVTVVERIRSPWLLPAATRQLDALTEELVDAAEESSLAAEASQVLPGVLGGDGPRRYLVAFTTPAEARGLGGFAGQFGELVADDGRIRLVRVDTIGVLTDEVEPDMTLEGMDGYLERYGSFRPGRYVGNTTVSPHFPDVAAALAQLYPQTPVGAPVDGVLVVDPYALAGFLRLTGPVNVEGLDAPLGADEAPSFLLRDQYFLVPGTDQTERRDLLGDVAEATFDALTTRTTLPGPRGLADVFAPLVAGGRLRAWMVDRDAGPLLDRVGLSDGFPAAGGGDLLGVVSINRGLNKLDAYLERAVTYDVTFDPATGSASAVVEVRLRNGVPSGPLPAEVASSIRGRPDGTNESRLAVYTPLLLDAVTVDGEAVGVSPAVEFGVQRYEVLVELPPGGERVVRYELAGTVRPGTYRLVLHHQPLAMDDEVVVRLRLRDGWRVSDPASPFVADGATARAVLRLDRERVLTTGVDGP